jgi:tetratricopeptide (TPR) repeat protein
MTSRVSACSRYSTVGSEELAGLDIPQSKQLLLKAAEISEELWESSAKQAEDVVRLLGSHTLALIQAGAYIANGHSRLDQYPEVFRRHRDRLLRYPLSQAQSRYCDIYTTFEASAHVLESSGRAAAKDALHLLRVLSMLNYSILPLRIFEDAWQASRHALGNDDTESSLGTLSRWHVSQLPDFMMADTDEWDSYRLIEATSLLASLSLIARYSSAGIYGLSMHPVVHAWARDRLGPDQQNQAWIATGCIVALSASAPHTWIIQQRHLRPQIQSFLDIKVKTALSLGSGSVILPILLECGWILRHIRDDSRLGNFIEDIYTELDVDPTKPSKEYIPIYTLDATNLINSGYPNKAVQLLEYIVKIQESVLPEYHPDRLASQQELASAYQDNGQVVKAVQLLEYIIKIEESLLPEDHSDRLVSQHQLASAYQDNGQVVKAIQLLEHVVKIRESVLPRDHSDRLASQHELARVYQDNGQVVKAVQLLEHVVKIQELVLPEDHPSRLTSLHALASVYQDNGQVVKAVQMLEHVVKIRESVLPRDHSDRLISQYELASVYEDNGQVVKAVQLLEHVVKIQELVLPEDHSDRLVSQHELARVYQDNGQVVKAVQMLEHVVKIRESVLPRDHSD